MFQASSHCSSGKGYIVSTFHIISFHILSVDLIIKVLLWQRDLSIDVKALPFNGGVDSSSRRHENNFLVAKVVCAIKCNARRLCNGCILYSEGTYLQGCVFFIS